MTCTSTIAQPTGPGRPARCGCGRTSDAAHAGSDRRHQRDQDHSTRRVRRIRGMTATTTSARSDLSELGRSETALRTFLHGLPGVDQVGAEQRAAQLGTRSIKTTAKAQAIDLAIRMVDLTTLEGADTPGKVRALAAKALRPDPADPTCPHVGAVCVYPAMVPYVAEVLRGSGVHLASVATAFPSGQAPLEVKLADTRAAVAAGADEIDMVINRGAFLAGRYERGLRRDRGHQGGLRGRPPQGDPGDRRAGHLRQRAAGLLAGHAGRRRLHQDLHRQGPGRGHPAGDPGDAGGGPRLPRRHRAAGRRQAGRRHQDHQGRDQVPGDGQRDRRRRTGSTRTGSGSARPACSTTC